MNRRASTLSNRKSRRGHSRTLLGCLTCRLRRVRCSLERPVCHNCCRLSLQCAGYGTKLKWLSYEARDDGRGVTLYDGNKPDGQRGAGRREMFSLAGRKRMSQHLLECLGGSQELCDIECSLNAALESIENEGQSNCMNKRDLAAIEAANLQAGPFGVFSLNSSLVQQESPDLWPLDSATPREDDDATEQNSMLSLETVSPDRGALDTTTSIISRTNVADGDLATSHPAISHLFAAAGLVLDAPVSEVFDGTNGRPATPTLCSSSLDRANHDDPATLDVETPNADIAVSTSVPSSHELRGDSVLASTSYYNTQPVWQPTMPPVDYATPAEMKMLLLHFESHLAGLLSPCPLPGQSIRGEPCADAALSCYGRLTLLGDASTGACALLYSLLGMSAAHMDRVYNNPAVGDVESVRLNSDDTVSHLGGTSSNTYRLLARRYIHLTQMMVKNSFETSLPSKRAINGVLASLLNLFSIRAISSQQYPLPDLRSRSVLFLSRIAPRAPDSPVKSKRILCFEFLLLQECILDGALSLVAPILSQPTTHGRAELQRLDTPGLWAQFGLPKLDSANGMSSTDVPNKPVVSLSASELHQKTGSPVPPSLLRLFLKNTLLLWRLRECSHDPSLGAEIELLEEDICGWRPDEDEAQGVAGPMFDDESDISFEGRDAGEVERDIGESSFPETNAIRPELIAPRLTHAYHTALILVFFSCTRPSSAFFLQPLQEKLLNQLDDYVDAIESAEVNVGIGKGLRWPMQVLQALNPNRRCHRRMQSLSVYTQNMP